MRRILIFLFAIAVLAAWTVPSYATEVTFSGTWRIRLFSLDDRDFNENASDASSSINQRFRLNIKARSSDDFGGKIQLQMGNATWGLSGAATPTARQAYLDFNVATVHVKAGRQYFKLPGDPFSLVLVSVLDAFVASTKAGPATIYGAFAKTAEVDSGTGANDDDTNVYILGAQADVAEGVNAGAFWVVQKAGVLPTTIHWFGANASAKAGPVNIKGEIALRSGSDDNAAASACAPVDCDYSGWAGVVDASMNATDQIKAGVLLGIGSGDDDANLVTDNDAETFMGIAPSFNITDIVFDNGTNGNGGATNPGVLAQAGGIGGVLVIRPYVVVKVNDQIKITGKYAWLQYVEDNQSNLFAGSGVRDDALGSEIDLQLDYTIHSASKLGLRLQANWFFPGDGALAMTTSPDDQVSEYYARIQYNF